MSLRNFPMSQVLPGLYVGNYRDSKDEQQLNHYKITHILAIHDRPRRLLPDKHYLCIMASDTPDQNLSQYFAMCNDFIHGARIRDGVVLIHCLAGMSRSVTVAVAYIMSVTNLTWKEALKVVRTGRAVANPNAGFQSQLHDFEAFRLADERRRLRERFPGRGLCESDRDLCSNALNSYEQLLSNRDICEGNCARGQNCPTGLCNADPKPGVLRRKSSNLSTRSRLMAPAGNGSTAQQYSASCPTSPHQLGGVRRSSRFAAAGSASEGVGGGASADAGGSSAGLVRDAAASLQRSASTISAFRHRSSPAGLYSYTGSAPSSVHGSRHDMTACSSDRGSAIYVGCSAPRSGSTWSVARSGAAVAAAPASGGGTLPSIAHSGPAKSSSPKTVSRSAAHATAATPPISPKHAKKRLANNKKP